MKLPNWSLLDNKLPTLRMPAMKEPVARQGDAEIAKEENEAQHNAKGGRASKPRALSALSLVAALLMALASTGSALGDNDPTSGDGITVRFPAPTEMMTVAPTEQVSAEPAPTVAPLSEPVSREVEVPSGAKARIIATEFGATAPEDIAKTFSHPKLAGWECLAGAVWTTAHSDWNADRLDGSGIVAFGKGDERLLALLCRKPDETAWQLYPVGEQALLRGREFHIACGEKTLTLEIVYPISAEESERFVTRVRYIDRGETQDSLLELYEYRRMNDKTGDGIVINSEAKTDAERYLWYHVTTYKAGEPTGTAFYPVTLSSYMNFIDAEAFPKSEEECKTAPSFTVPEGYGVTCGVHLRKGKSSRSADLGDFKANVFVKVLGLEPGDPYDWVKVQVGGLEGYMSSIYVQYYDETPCAMRPIEQYVPLPVAQTKKDTVLKAGTGWFDGRVAELEQGARMHVLADCGCWLYVCVPSGDLEWYMDVNGTYGYIWKDDVTLGASALHLDWME